ncbi:MAG: hypothetical protein KC503_28650 [Myxococcales bacterium]|nr:hypothetical protein [Myxococcales bacterium]
MTFVRRTYLPLPLLLACVALLAFAALLALVGSSALAAPPPPSPRYLVYSGGRWQKMSRRQLVKARRRGTLWSARLSTGLLGSTHCSAGNRGPKSPSEIVLAVGDAGLRKLVELGFVGCPACKPAAKDGFWQTVSATVKKTHGLSSLAQFEDRQLVPFDASRVRFEEILPHLGTAPGRLYVPSSTSASALTAIKQRFEALGVGTPEVGSYDRNAEGRFRRLTQ